LVEEARYVVEEPLEAWGMLDDLTMAPKERCVEWRVPEKQEAR